MKSLKLLAKKIIHKLGYDLIKNDALIHDRIFLQSRSWDIDFHEGYWVGGKFKVNNFSGGYHGILKQWWESYGTENSDFLLISENNVVKKTFVEAYPRNNFSTLDFYDNMGEDVDLHYNLCDTSLSGIDARFDVIVCQATLEHVYDPWSALKNMTSILSDGGVILIHTHVPGYYYHPYPRDYVRFHPDWFIDAEQFLPSITLKELFVKDCHIFAAFKKN